MSASTFLHRSSGIAVVAALCFLSSVATALPPEAGGDDSAPVTGGVPADAATRAGIPEAKQKEILRLTTDANLELQLLRQKHRAAQAELEALLNSDAPSEKAVLAQVEAMGVAETAIRKNRVALMLRIRKLLGPALWSSLQRELSSEAVAQQPAPATDNDTARVGDPVRTETTSGTVHAPPQRH